MQNDKEFLSSLFNAIGQGLSDGLELNEAMKPKPEPKRQPQWWGDKSQCMNPLDESGEHHWLVEHRGESTDRDVFRCTGCHEKRFRDDAENQPWNDDLNPQ